ncbi:hypothetical protein EGW08_020618 [Elysia chlorotica]|uniref:Uncharacterized protein n=1 Tax=Elysia chlorotica TaxID=188477 RepID=A0A433SQV4_ELYCH|nr:hypothetical protein EGW08_020618 [Elysia chlorotica]
MRSTLTAACEIQANLEPLSIRREKAALELTERCLRLPNNNATKVLVENWKGKSRLKHQSILHKTQKLKDKCHLPETRALTERVMKIPPHIPLLCPEIELKLIDENVTKPTDLSKLKRTAERTFESYAQDWIHFYTDESAFKATVNAGYGALKCFRDGSSKEIYSACGETCFNYERKEQSASFRLRMQHISLNFNLNRLNPELTPQCPNESLETVEHTLVHCPSLSQPRQQFLPMIPDLHTALYSTSAQLQRTAAFFFMAIGKRKQAQRPLD